jgi:hypothetical protein
MTKNLLEEAQKPSIAWEIHILRERAIHWFKAQKVNAGQYNACVDHLNALEAILG